METYQASAVPGLGPWCLSTMRFDWVEVLRCDGLVIEAPDWFRGEDLGFSPLHPHMSKRGQ